MIAWWIAPLLVTLLALGCATWSMRARDLFEGTLAVGIATGSAVCSLILWVVCPLIAYFS